MLDIINSFNIALLLVGLTIAIIGREIRLNKKGILETTTIIKNRKVIIILMIIVFVILAIASFKA